MMDGEFFANFNFCCNGMESRITMAENMQKGQAIVYHRAERVFSILVIKDKYAINMIDNCPYCGVQLPKDLREKHCEIIKKELGEDYLDYFEDGEWHSPKKELPEEFKTDEWWKKRGL